MHRSLAAAVFTLVILASSFSDAQGFDGKRGGFILGIAGGYGDVFKVSDRAPGVEGQGLLTELVLGHGVTDRWLVHYSGRQVWGSHQGILYTAMFPSLAVTYFTHHQAPSLYLTGSLGLGAAGDLAIEGGRGDVGGVAVFGGIGFEFARHFGVEAAAGLLDSEIDNTYGTVGVTLKAIGY